MTSLTAWGTHPLSNESPAYFNFKVLKIWARYQNDEIWLAYLHSDETEYEQEGPNPSSEIELAWQRWALGHTVSEIELIPVLPNLPVVVKPEFPFRLAQNAQTRIYVRVPVWIRVKAKNTHITEIPAVVLSKTWFGNFQEGELSYWISSSARKRIEADPERPYLAICPINITNQADTELQVEKICLRVNRLGLYRQDGQLWAAETRAFYKGRAEGSEIEVSRKAPPEAAKAALISSPRDVVRKGFTARTFESLMELPGMGLFRG